MAKYKNVDISKLEDCLKRGLTIEQTAKEMKICRETVDRRIYEHNLSHLVKKHYISIAKLNQLKELAKLDITYMEIAKRTGIEHRKIKDYVKHYKLDTYIKRHRRYIKSIKVKDIEKLKKDEKLTWPEVAIYYNVGLNTIKRKVEAHRKRKKQ